MAFRGFGDDAMKVAADQRQERVQRAQIAASERASQRSAANQAASLNENARQADMADSRARTAQGDETATRVATIAGGEALRRDELAASQKNAAADRGIRQQGMDLSRRELDQRGQAQQFDAAAKTEDLRQRDRQISLNEATFTKAQIEAQRQQDAENEMQQVGTAAQLAAMRAAVVSDRPLPVPFINSINDARGVAYGEPDSVTMITPIIEPNTGARLGVGVRKIGKDGVPVDSILDPVELFPKLRASMSPESWTKLFGEVTGGQRSRGNDRTTVAAQMEHTKFEKDREAALAKEQTRLEASLANPKMLLDDVEAVKTKIAKIAGVREGMLGLEDPAPKTPTSDFGTLPTGGTPAAAPIPATAKPSAGTATNLSVGAVRKLANGQSATYIGEGKWRVDAAQAQDSSGSPFAESFNAPDAISPPGEFQPAEAAPAAKPTPVAATEKSKPAAKTFDNQADTTIEAIKEIPKGKSTGWSNAERSKARNEILRRLEASYRRYPKSEGESKEIKAELDAFNEKYGV